MKKFFVRTLTQVSFADTGAWCETTARKYRATARGKTKRFIKIKAAATLD
jgi:ureidoglycolate hydrolase